MKFQATIFVIALVASVSLQPPCAAGETPALNSKGARILVCANYWDLLHIPAVRRLTAAGAEVRQGDLAKLTWDEAKQYHLIIAVAQSPDPTAGNQSVHALEQFVKTGGGLLFFRRTYDDPNSTTTNAFLKPFDASMLWELVQDPEHTFHSTTGFALAYAYTDRIARGHPITAGVKAIWYSAEKTFLLHTSPLRVSADWKVLATAAPEASTMWVGGLNEEHLTKPGSFSSAPPIIAAREYGRGRVVLVGISPLEAFYGQGLPVYGDVLMEKGDGLRSSGWGRLYDNSLRWLAGRATASDQIGQGTLQPIENPWEKADVHDWSKEAVGGDVCTRPARGVIGLHSTLSDGKASPEALIAQARQSGLQWVAFTEKLESLAADPWKPRDVVHAGVMPETSGRRIETLSPAKWEQLRKICREASTPQFAALPGLDYQDNSGTRYVVFGDFDWPPEKTFSKDKQRIIEPQWWFNINCMPNGPYDIGHAPLRFWDMTLYSFFPIRTTVAGKKLDEAPEGYRHMQGVQDDPAPMAVDMCYDEAQLTGAAGRMCNFVLQDQPGDLNKLLGGGNYYGSGRSFASDGPIVTDWRAINGTRTSGGKWWAPGTEQYRVKLSVRSRAAITDVRIYDGPVLLRRFCPRQTAATLTFDMPHDQQRNLVAEITDARGGRAITGGLFIRDLLNWRFMCSDRGNSICDAVQADEFGAYLTGPTAPYQRKMTAFPGFPGYGERHFHILPPDLDGGMRPVALNYTPSFQSPGYTYLPPGGTLETRMGVPVCSRDGLLQHDELVGYFPGQASSWQPKPPPKNLEGVKVHYRYLDITARAHDPGVLLVEGSLSFQRAMKLESLSLLGVGHATQPGEGDHYALVTPGTNVAGMVAGQAFGATGRMVPGSYGCIFPSLWGSAGLVALDEGYVMSVYAKAPGIHLGAQLADMPREMKAGETLHYRYVLMHGRTGEDPNTADWERFAQTMGFRGPPAYEVKDVRAGSVKGTKFLLELAPGDGGFSGTVTQSDLPIRLPVRVAEMNPNWTFGWFDLDRKEWYPSAVDREIGQGFFTLDTRRGAHRLFAGHPVLADNPDVRIAAFSDGKSVVRATLNNIGDTPVSLMVRLNPALGAAAPQHIELPAGAIKDLTFALNTSAQ